MNPIPSNCFRVLTDLARRYAAGAVTVVASALVLPALANTITFETANLGVFTSSVTENGFIYSKLGGALFVAQFGNSGKDAEGTISGGGMLKIVSATGSDFNFNGLDFSPLIFPAPDRKHSRSKDFLADRPSEWINIHLPTPRSSIRNTIIGPRKPHLCWPAKASLSSISP